MELRPTHTTIVWPDEYDIEKDVTGAIKLANDGKGHPDAPYHYILFDVGKLVGLYLAYKEQLADADDLALAAREAHSELVTVFNAIEKEIPETIYVSGVVVRKLAGALEKFKQGRGESDEL